MNYSGHEGGYSGGSGRADVSDDASWGVGEGSYVVRTYIGDGDGVYAGVYRWCGAGIVLSASYSSKINA